LFIRVDEAERGCHPPTAWQHPQALLTYSVIRFFLINA
jgi:hypothetical protein